MYIQERRTVAEIGVGETPFPLAGKRPLASYERYVGIDIDFQTARIAKRNLARDHRFSSRQIHIVCADANALPFFDRSVKEIIFPNLLSHERAKADIEQIVTEAGRVVSVDGTIAVLETISPNETPLHKVRKLLADAGFKQASHVSNPFNDIPQENTRSAYLVNFQRGRISRWKRFVDNAWDVVDKVRRKT